MSTDVLVFISSFQSSVRISASLTTQGWERQTEEKPSLYSEHMNYKLCHATTLLKYWASFLNTLNLFSSPFMHDLLPIPWLAQGSGDGSTANRLLQLQGEQGNVENVAEPWPSLNMGLSLIGLQRINLINAYDTKEWFLFSEETSPKINLSLEELKKF